MSNPFAEQQAANQGGQATSDVSENALAEAEFDFANATVKVDNPERDFSLEVAPPPEGEHRLRITLAEFKEEPNAKGIVTEMSPLRNRYSSKVGPYIQCNIELEVVAEGEPYNGRRVYFRDFLSTIMNKGKGTSPVHDMMYKLGEGLPADGDFTETKERIRTVLQKQPQIKGYVKWAATRQLEQGEKQNNNKYFNRFTIADGADEFPLAEDGVTHQNWVEYHGEKVFAQGHVTTFLS